MKKQPVGVFLKDPARIHKWLEAYCIISGTVSISDTGMVDVIGDVKLNPLAESDLTHFAVQFSTITGNFDCSGCLALTSLMGAPQYVSGNFKCKRCPNLETLEGGPVNVGSFLCEACKLQSLKGGPISISGFYSITGGENLTSLEGMPLHIGRAIYFWKVPLEITGVAHIEDGRVFATEGTRNIVSVQQLLLHQTKVATDGALASDDLGIQIANRYHYSGDLLTAIAEFEDYFKVSFGDIIAPTPLPSDITL